MKLQIMNCYGDKISVDIGKLKDILSISVTVLSGDEVLHVVKKNGEMIEEDSDRHGRSLSYYDGQYTIYNSAIGLNIIKEWRKRKDSNDWVGVIKW